MLLDNITRSQPVRTNLIEHINIKLITDISTQISDNEKLRIYATLSNLINHEFNIVHHLDNNTNDSLESRIARLLIGLLTENCRNFWLTNFNDACC